MPSAAVSRACAPPLHSLTGYWARPIAKNVGFLADDEFVFLNRRERLGLPGGWNDASLPKLWLYNLHYFDDLCADAGEAHAALCERLIGRWIADNPPAGGNGWEPYTLSLRIVNWIKFALGGRALSSEARLSLAMQVRALEHRIERHILGNHLFANGKALTFAGLYFSGAEGARWLRKGLEILDQELGEQVLADGGHFERSPMYHAIILEDVLDLLNLCAAFPGEVDDRRPRWVETANRMRRWLAAMRHPDGDISFFNDCALGVVPEPAATEAYAARLGLEPLPSLEEVIDLRESGYVCVRRGGLTLLFDAAPIGPDYQPGHAHADTLSLELSAGARRVLVNGGVSTYAEGPARARERATASHNTVEIEGQNSSEVWAAFRVARRARVRTRTISRAADGAIVLAASHDGYQRLRGRPVVSREISFGPDEVAIIDRIEGELSSAISRFRLAPGLSVSIKDGGRAGVVLADGVALLGWRSSHPGELAAISHAVGFNRCADSQEVRFRFDRAREVKITWRVSALPR